MATQIKIQDGILGFSGDRLATVEEYETGDRCIGSIYEALEPSEQVELQEGLFRLDNELDLVIEVKLEEYESLQHWAAKGHEWASEFPEEDEPEIRPCTCGSGQPWVSCSEASQYCG